MKFLKPSFVKILQFNLINLVCLVLCLSLVNQSRQIVSANQLSSKPRTVSIPQAVDEYPFDCVLSLRDQKNSEVSHLPFNPSANMFSDEIELAAMYAVVGQQSKALEILAQAEKSLTQSNDIYLCLTLVSAEQYDRAIELLTKIEKLEDRVETSVRITKALAEHKQNEKAAGLLSQVIANFKPVASKAFILSNIAVTYAKIGQFEKALEFARRIENRWAHVKTEAFSEIANEYAKNGNKSEASAILKQALDAARIVGNDEVNLLFKAENFAQIAAVYVNNEQKAEALKVLSEGLGIAKKTETQSLPLEKLAVVYAQAKEYDTALNIAKSIDYKPSELDVYLETAKEMLKDGQSANALPILDQAFEGTRKLKRENDTFKIIRLAEIAIVYANANQTARAYDALHFALQTIRLEYSSTQIGHLIETAKGFYKANLKIDAESKEQLRKICAKEPIPPTSYELEKRRKCEAVADHFIQRWHETLDLNVLFDEMYIANPQQRKRNVAMFYGVYKFLVGSAGPAVEPGFNDEIFQAGFFAFWNEVYLSDEGQLAIPNDQEFDRHTQLPPDVLKEEEALKTTALNDKEMSVKSVQKFIEVTNLKLAFLRKQFPREVFESATYRASLQQRYEEQKKNEFEKEFQIIQGFSDFGVKDEVEVYHLKRGVFDFYFIEEAGKLKVLTLGFEL
ncbi:MAG: hypothetical protein HY231_12320 [Acidobacteria bacterium]|nr:hypothetical protein [Acidobacteriota bacterium]